MSINSGLEFTKLRHSMLVFNTGGWIFALLVTSALDLALAASSEDGNQGERKDSWIIAWLQKIANSMTALKKWLHKGLNAIIIEKMHSNEHIKVLWKFFAIIFSISFEKLISNLRCVWPNCKIPIKSNLLVYYAIIFSLSLNHREYSK